MKRNADQSLSSCGNAKKKSSQENILSEEAGSSDSEKSSCACSFCGRHDFESDAAAALHQASCSQSYPKGPWKCSVCGKTDFTASSGFASHRQTCRRGVLQGRTVSLRPACLSLQRQLLADFNVLVTDSIELIELSSSQDIARLSSGNRRKNSPKLGDIGIRCRYCAENNLQPPGSTMYPETLKTLPHNMYNMVCRHLVSVCQSIPKKTQQKLVHDKQNATKQSMLKDRIGLPVYLKLVINEFGLIDGGENRGIHRTQVH